MRCVDSSRPPSRKSHVFQGPQRGLDQRIAPRGRFARVVRLRHRRRHGGVIQQSSGGYLSDREPGIPRHAGHSTRRRTRLHRPGHRHESAGVSRGRRLRSSLPARKDAAWPAHLYQADGTRTGAANRARDRRRDSARQGLRQRNRRLPAGVRAARPEHVELGCARRATDRRSRRSSRARHSRGRCACRPRRATCRGQNAR
jgi:hypothetical protein